MLVLLLYTCQDALTSISSQAHLHVYFIVYSVALRMTQLVKQQLNMYEANKRLGREFFQGRAPGESRGKPSSIFTVYTGFHPAFWSLKFSKLKHFWTSDSWPSPGNVNAGAACSLCDDTGRRVHHSQQNVYSDNAMRDLHPPLCILPKII